MITVEGRTEEKRGRRGGQEREKGRMKEQRKEIKEERKDKRKYFIDTEVCNQLKEEQKTQTNPCILSTQIK